MTCIKYTTSFCCCQNNPVTCIISLYCKLVTCIISLYCKLFTCIISFHCKLFPCIISLYCKLVTCIVSLYCNTSYMYYIPLQQPVHMDCIITLLLSLTKKKCVHENYAYIHVHLCLDLLSRILLKKNKKQLSIVVNLYRYINHNQVQDLFPLTMFSFCLLLVN